MDGYCQFDGYRNGCGLCYLVISMVMKGGHRWLTLIARSNNLVILVDVGDGSSKGKIGKISNFGASYI